MGRVGFYLQLLNPLPFSYPHTLECFGGNDCVLGKCNVSLFESQVGMEKSFVDLKVFNPLFATDLKERRRFTRAEQSDAFYVVYIDVSWDG